MGQEFVNMFKELVDRLKEANQERKLLEHVKLIEGPEEENIQHKTLPCIIYEVLDGGAERPRCLPRGVEGTMIVLLTAKVAIGKGYYNDTRTGMLDMSEKIMDVINGDTAIALKGNGHWGVPSPQFRVGGFTKDKLCLTYFIEVTLVSPKYTKGSLQD